MSIASRTAEPTEAHWQLCKRVMRYLKGTKELGVTFRREKLPELVGYCDADYANCVETRRSTTGYCIKFAGRIIAWKC